MRPIQFLGPMEKGWKASGVWGGGVGGSQREGRNLLGEEKFVGDRRMANCGIMTLVFGRLGWVVSGLERGLLV